MPFSHTGFDILDATPGTVRVEMSDLLKVSLMQLPNLGAALRFGAPGGGGAPVGASAQQVLHYWIETGLNARVVTDTTGGGQNNTDVTSTLTLSLNDGALVFAGDYIQDNSQSELTAEQMRVESKAVSGATVLVTVTRAVNSTPKTTHAANAVYGVIAAARPAGSNVGPDMSRSPVIKANYFQQHRKDVVITGEMDELAKRGLVPGIPNQPAFQLHERFWELLQDLERSFIRGKGTPAAVSTDVQTMWGLLAFYGYGSPTTLPNSTAVVMNANGAALSDTLFSQLVINITGQGGEVPDAILAHMVGIDRTARIFRDLLYLSQAEVVRGFTVDAIRVTLGHKLIKLIMSNYMPDPTLVEPVLLALDLSRAAIIPFYNRGLFLKTSPTMLDAKLVSLLSQLTLEVRNTGTDVGYTGQAMRNWAI